MSSGMKRLLILASVGILALGVVGFVFGAIGSAFLGTDVFLSKPHVTLPAHELTSVGPLAITNALLSSWVTTVLLVLLFFLATRRMNLVPRGLQNVMELAVEGLNNFVTGVAGPEYGRRFLPIIATIFLFVMTNAWLGLIPIYQSLGIFEHGELEAHFLRPAGTDVNMPLALALISFVYFEFWGLRAHGFRYLGEFIRIGSLFRGFPRNLFMGLIDFFVGILELLSHLIRAVSLTFRLFGNMTAGEILLLVMAFLIPFVSILPFYALELFVGFIQALVFAGLTLVFAVVAVAPVEGEGH